MNSQLNDDLKPPKKDSGNVQEMHAIYWTIILKKGTHKSNWHTNREQKFKTVIRSLDSIPLPYSFLKFPSHGYPETLDNNTELQ